jgi:RND family efflux transporter MFP subunit
MLISVFLSYSSFAHEGHNEKKAESKAKNYFTSEAFSDKYELFLKYAPITPGKEETLTLFLSDFNTNAPIDSAILQISSSEDEKLKFVVMQTGPGTYSVTAIFPEKKSYSLTINVNGKQGFDLLLLEGIEAGKELIVMEEEHAGGTWLNNPIMLFGGGLLAGVIVMFLVMKMRQRKINPTAVALIIVMLGVPLNNTNLSAHEGHNEAAKKGGNALSNSFEVPKETQFLFGILTEKIEAREFVENTKLFGTVIPSSKGQATIQAPQTSKIVSLNINVGQHVERGQVIAVIEPVIDAGSLVNFLAEHNNVDAEIEAARKEYERLKVIEDIAAKRDLVESEARYQKARQNKELYDKLTSGQSDKSRTVSLRSPIAGIVGNFTFSIGATVNASEVIFTVYDLSKVYIEAQVFDNDAAKVNQATRFVAESTQDANKKAEIKLLAPAQTINPTNQSQKVIFEMDNKDGAFKIGEFVNLRAFGAKASQQLTVPNIAIKEINGKPVIFIKDNAEQYSVSYLTTGTDDGSRTIVLKGLEAGERIVVNASYQVKMIYLNQ